MSERIKQFSPQLFQVLNNVESPGDKTWNNWRKYENGHFYEA